MRALALVVMLLLVVAGCAPTPGEEPCAPPGASDTPFVLFPALPGIDPSAYENIRQTCAERWSMEDMQMETFSVRPDRDEYLVECDGLVEGELYRLVLRVDSQGEWINDGRRDRPP